MKRRQLLQMGVTATTLPGLANTISAKPTGKLPMVLTRGHFETKLTYEGRRFTGQKVVLKDGHTKTGYDTNGSVPGIDRGCVQDLTVVIHGLDVAASGAIDKVQEYKRSLQRAGYEGTVIGYSWDSDIAGKLGFGLAEDCADKNAPKLARFLTEYRRACPNGVLRLVSHSLGARVIMETLKVLEANKSGIKIDSVHMLGAAIDNEAPTREWPASYRAFANRVGHTFNYWNSDDPVLTFAYPGWPLGESGVEWGNTPPENYTDIKVTAQAGSSHSNYMAVAAWVVNDMYKARKPDDGSSGGGGDGGNDGDSGGRFSNGDQVESTTDLNTRARPDTGSSVRVTVPPGTTGKITGGPTEKGGYTWWKVNWTNRGVEGWSAGKYLKPSAGSGGGGNVSGEADAWKPAAASNYTNASRAGKINWIVLHVTEGSYEGSINWFQNPSANVSAHYVLRNADGHATQMVRHEDIAWHAGGQNYNEYSIGIEHEGHVGQTNFTDALYQKSAAIVRRLCEQYDIPKRHPGSAVAPCDATAAGGIIGHHQVPEANCGPNDHTDPGSTWDWEQFMALVRGDGGGGNGNDGGDGGNGGGRFSAGDRVASTTNLNTRARPGTDAAIRETVSPGTTGKITGDPTQEGGYTWWKVQWETGVQGWSAGRYLTPGTGGGSGSFSDGDRVASTTNLNTRHRPGLDSRVLKTMSPGAVGEIMNGPVRKDGYTWWGVHWLEDDLWGWSAGRYLKKK